LEDEEEEEEEEVLVLPAKRKANAINETAKKPRIQKKGKLACY
jgi:hypothetical protein